MTKTITIPMGIVIHHRNNTSTQTASWEQFRALINYSRLFIVSREITHLGTASERLLLYGFWRSGWGGSGGRRLTGMEWLSVFTLEITLPPEWLSSLCLPFHLPTPMRCTHSVLFLIFYTVPIMPSHWLSDTASTLVFCFLSSQSQSLSGSLCLPAPHLVPTQRASWLSKTGSASFVHSMSSVDSILAAQFSAASWFLTREPAPLAILWETMVYIT